MVYSWQYAIIGFSFFSFVKIVFYSVPTLKHFNCIRDSCFVVVSLRRPEVKQMMKVSEIIDQAGEPRLLFLYEQKLTENPYIVFHHKFSTNRI
jgi:hypothetical protein